MRKAVIELVRDNAHFPTKGTAQSAGYDLYAAIPDEMSMEDEDGNKTGNVLIKAGETVKVPLGIRSEIPQGSAAFIYARSGLATKYGLAPANKVGVIDSDYRGEWFLALHNDSKKDRTISTGDRVAQFVFHEVPDIMLESGVVHMNTERNEDGFGSTGQ